jgi:hypothetical protein
MTVNQGYAREVKRWNKGEVNDWLSPHKSFPHSKQDETESGIGFTPRRSKPTLTRSFQSMGLLNN